MADNVVRLNMVTRLPISPDVVIDAAKEAGLGTVVVLGYLENGEEYFASSTPDGGDVVWLMERTKLKLLRVADDA